MTPGFTASAQAVGSYRRNEKTLQMQFADEIVLTPINKASKKTDVWKLRRIPNAWLPHESARSATVVESPIVLSSNAVEWTFNLNIHRMVGIIGIVREESPTSFSG